MTATDISPAPLTLPVEVPTRPKLRRVFLDIETTGLDPDVHEVVEVAWATDEGPVRSLVLPHRFERPNPFALKVNGYLERGLYDRDRWATDAQVTRLHSDLVDATIVGANPRFDVRFLERFFAGQPFTAYDTEPWHYRLLDVQAYGMAVLGMDTVPGLADLQREVRALGIDVPEPDHTAAADVETTRAVFHGLRSMRSHFVLQPESDVTAEQVRRVRSMRAVATDGVVTTAAIDWALDEVARPSITDTPQKEN